jgi:hypothetical protein
VEVKRKEHDRCTGQDLGLEGTRRGRESPRKIFERAERVDREIPGYIIKEECKRNRLSGKAGKRAAKFEDKMD